MKWPWQRDDQADMDVENLLAAPPTSPADLGAPVVPSGSFRLVIEDVFNIAGRGTVATGKIESGSVAVGQQVALTQVDGTSRAVTVTGVEMFRKVLEVANAGDYVGLLLSDVAKGEVAAGDVLSA